MNHIVTCKCDSCNEEKPSVVFHHYGTPVLNSCASCDKDNFEAQARRDIDNWLNGGDDHPFHQ